MARLARSPSADSTDSRHGTPFPLTRRLRRRRADVPRSRSPPAGRVPDTPLHCRDCRTIVPPRSIDQGRPPPGCRPPGSRATRSVTSKRVTPPATRPCSGPPRRVETDRITDPRTPSPLARPDRSSCGPPFAPAPARSSPLPPVYTHVGSMSTTASTRSGRTASEEGDDVHGHPVAVVDGRRRPRCARPRPDGPPAEQSGTAPGRVRARSSRPRVPGSSSLSTRSRGCSSRRCSANSPRTGSAPG